MVAIKLLLRSALATSSAATLNAAIFLVSSHIRIAGERLPSSPTLCTPIMVDRFGTTRLDK